MSDKAEITASEMNQAITAACRDIERMFSGMDPVMQGLCSALDRMMPDISRLLTKHDKLTAKPCRGSFRARTRRNMRARLHD